MSLLGIAGLRPLAPYRLRSIIALVSGVCAPIVFAWVGQNSGEWDLFERSGALTTAIGLLVASRRYLEYGILELAMPRSGEDQESGFGEVLEDVFTAKLGLALSAFGTIIWGWGKYLGWWAFSCLVIWALFVIRDAHRDSARLRGTRTGMTARKIEAKRSGESVGET